MVSSDFTTKIDAIFADVIGINPKNSIKPLIYNETEGWNSVAHMILVAALEEEFSCLLEMDDILSMSSYEATIKIMEKYDRSTD